MENSMLLPSEHVLLPFDIIFIEILSRLPLEFILRFKSVSKSWCRTIEQDPSLATKHLNRAIEKPGTLITVTQVNTRDKTVRTSYSFAKDDGSKRRTSFHAPDVLKFSRLAGTCNGLLCFSEWTNASKCLIVNLTLQEYIIVPAIHKPLQTLQVDAIRAYGLGFSPAAKEYKVLSYAYGETRSSTSSVIAAYKVYTLGTSAWRDLSSAPSRQLRGRPVYANGCLYWKVDLEASLISFDIGKEEFSVVKHPALGSQRRDLTNLVDIRGCIAMADLSYNKHIDIWMLKNNNSSKMQYWVREYVLKINSSISRPTLKEFKVIGVLQEDEILLEWYCLRYLSYDTKADEVRYHNHMNELIVSDGNIRRMATACSYTRSLMSLKSYGSKRL